MDDQLPAEELTSRGHDVSRQYLGDLITGRPGEPRCSLLEALADVFSVPVAYFSDDYLGRVTNDLLPLLVALQDPNVRACCTAATCPRSPRSWPMPTGSPPPPRCGNSWHVGPARGGRSVLTTGLPGVGRDPAAGQVLATLRAPVVQSAIEETLANWLKYGTGPRR